MHLLIRWLVYAVALALVASIFPKIRLKGFGSALIASAVIGILNVTLGWILHVLTFPINWITLGLFAWVVNGFLFWLAGELLDGFDVEGWLTAILGAVVYTLLSTVILHLLGYPATFSAW